MATALKYKVVPGKTKYIPTEWIEFVEKFEEITKGLPEVHVIAMRKSMEKARRIITTQYLTGPRPEKLGVVTGRLRSSIHWKIKRLSKSVIEGSIGTNVFYAKLHEEGFVSRNKNGQGSSIRVVKEKRPFLKPGIEDAYPFMYKYFEKAGLQLMDGKK